MLLWNNIVLITFLGLTHFLTVHPGMYTLSQMDSNVMSILECYNTSSREASVLFSKFFGFPAELDGAEQRPESNPFLLILVWRMEFIILKC